jgi:hypothetical protein
MVNEIDLSTAMQLFDTEVTIRYQNKQYLANTVTERHGTTGTATNVPVSAQIELENGGFAPMDIPITNVDEVNVVITPFNFRIKTVVGGAQKTLFAYDKIVTQAKLHALAAGRLVDFEKINAIFTDPNFSSIAVVPVNVGVNNGLNESKMSQGLSDLEANGVDVSNYSCSLWSSALLKQSLLQDQQVTNIFFNDVKPLTSNKIQSYLGTDIRFLGESGVNKIPSTFIGPVQNWLVPLVHEDAVVQTFNRDISTSITWLPWQDRWELVTTVTTGASVIQERGIILLTCQNPF